MKSFPTAGGVAVRYLRTRLTEHRYKKNKGLSCSSSKLNLYNCIIIPLEECDDKDRHEREKYWINKLDCVNTLKLNGRNTNENYKRYYHKNILQRREYYRNYYHANKKH